MERLSIRTGVPVFIRAERMPWRVMLSVKWGTAGSAIRPPGTIFLPMCIKPFRKVPQVMMTAFALISAPQIVLTPTTCLVCSPTWRSECGAQCCATATSSTSNSSAWSCQMSRLGVASKTERHFQMNFPLSHWARGLQTAGPFERFSIRNWMAVASVTNPIWPPKASISRTICPFAIPPTAGLHDICAILFISIVTSNVLAPMLAEAVAASHPACPPPITITSYFKIMLQNYE